MRRLIIDTSNLIFRVAAANDKYNNQPGVDLAGLSMHSTLMTIRSHFKKIKPDQLAFAFEGSANWRKEHTRSPQCVSRRLYKGNRVRDEKMNGFFELIGSFEALAREHTSMVCLSNPRLEGDDLIAGYVQKYAETGDEVFILSGDKDFMQLLRRDNIFLIDPDTGKDRRHAEKYANFDPDYFIFEKCFRGDSGDNVLPAYPRVRSTKLEAAFKDELARANLMGSTWQFVDPETGSARDMSVRALWEENKLLMDLTAQPVDIRQLITETVDREVVQHGKFSLFHFQKFCGKYGLKKVSESATDFAHMFSITGKNSPHKEETRQFHEEKKKGLIF
jgi:rRNA-processing protein FCF1